MTEELYHYGVKGMRWGVRRAQKRLSNPSTTPDKRAKAIGSLEKHKAKATKKVAKLEKKSVKLEKKVERDALKVNAKAASLKRSALREKQRALHTRSYSKAQERMFRAEKLDTRAELLYANIEQRKALVKQNAKMREVFNTEIKNIDSILIKEGRRRLTSTTKKKN